MTLFDRHASIVLASSLLAAGCPSRTNTPATDVTDATDAGGTDTDYDVVTGLCLEDGSSRRSCLGGLQARCAEATSEDACVGQWSDAELGILGPLEVACRWHPEAMLVRVLYDADTYACEVLEHSSKCLGVVLTNDPDDPVGDPRCEPFGPLTCDGGVQSGRPQIRRQSNTDAWLVKPVECGAILGFDNDFEACQGDDPAAACGCFCE